MSWVCPQGWAAIPLLLAAILCVKASTKAKTYAQILAQDPDPEAARTSHL